MFLNGLDTEVGYSNTMTVDLDK